MKNKINKAHFNASEMKIIGLNDDGTSFEVPVVYKTTETLFTGWVSVDKKYDPGTWESSRWDNFQFNTRYWTDLVYGDHKMKQTEIEIPSVFEGVDIKDIPEIGISYETLISVKTIRSQKEGNDLTVTNEMVLKLENLRIKEEEEKKEKEINISYTGLLNQLAKEKGFSDFSQFSEAFCEDEEGYELILALKQKAKKEFEKQLKTKIMKVKVLTHGGVFHADEVIAIVILKQVFGEVEIEKTFKPTPENLENSEIFVLDIGGNYNPEKNNFDHHQNGLLGASNLLVFLSFSDAIAEKFCIAENEKTEFNLLVTKNFLNYISDVDCGKILEQNTANIPTICSLIRNLNNIKDGFEIALQVAESAFVGVCETAKLAVKGRTLWNGFEKLSEKVKLQETADFIPNWKELAIEEGIMLLIQKNLREGWQVVSRSTDELVLPIFEKQTFRHNSGFMCVFAEKQDAINFALSL